MATYTKTADQVFDPVTGGGAPRGADMSEARTWGTEVETAIADLEAAIAPLIWDQNSEVGTTYTLVLNDAGRFVEMNNAAANVLTIPPNASVALPLHTRIWIHQRGAGQTTIAPGAGVTLRNRNGLKLSGQYAVGMIHQRAANEWVVSGDMVP